MWLTLGQTIMSQISITSSRLNHEVRIANWVLLANMYVLEAISDLLSILKSVSMPKPIGPLFYSRALILSTDKTLFNFL